MLQKNPETIIENKDTKQEEIGSLKELIHPLHLGQKFQVTPRSEKIIEEQYYGVKFPKAFGSYGHPISNKRRTSISVNASLKRTNSSILPAILLLYLTSELLAKLPNKLDPKKPMDELTRFFHD